MCKSQKKETGWINVSKEEMMKEGSKTSPRVTCSQTLHCPNSNVSCDSMTGDCNVDTSAIDGSVLAIICDNKYYTCNGSGTISGSGSKGLNNENPIEGNKL